MAYKNIYRLTARRQGEVVGQIFRLINCYSEFFVPRTRTQIKDIGREENTIYWLEHPKNNEVTAIAILDKTYKFEIFNLDFYVLGHTIAKLPNQMNNVIDHIMGDYLDQNLMIFSRELFADALGIQDRYNFICLNVLDLIKFAPSLAEFETDYFSSGTQEKVKDGMARKNYNLYLKCNDEGLKLLKDKFSDIFYHFYTEN
jgi:hypothetical protein